MNRHLIPSSSLAPVLNSEKNNSGAEFTVVSNKTGKDYTYKIVRSEFNDKWFTHVKVETGHMQFKRLGTYFKGKIFNKKELVETPSAVAISYILNKVEKGDFTFLDNNVKVMHVGKCLCCGRPLTDAHSIEIGLGPVCANH